MYTPLPILSPIYNHHLINLPSTRLTTRSKNFQKNFFFKMYPKNAPFLTPLEPPFSDLSTVHITLPGGKILYKDLLITNT